MANTIASLETVRAAYKALTAAGTRPTAKAIHDHIGGGAQETLCRHLRAIRAEEAAAAASAPPSASEPVPAAETPVELPAALRKSLEELASCMAGALKDAATEAHQQMQQRLAAEATAYRNALDADRAAATKVQERLREECQSAADDFEAVAGEAQVLREILYSLLAVHHVEASDDVDALRTAAQQAGDRVQELLALAKRVSALKEELEAQREAALVADARIAKLAAAAAAGAEAVGHAAAWERIAARLADQLAGKAEQATPLAARPAPRQKNRRPAVPISNGAGTSVSDVMDDGNLGARASGLRYTVDQPLPLATPAKEAAPPGSATGHSSPDAPPAAAKG